MNDNITQCYRRALDIDKVNLDALKGEKAHWDKLKTMVQQQIAYDMLRSQ